MVEINEPLGLKIFYIIFSILMIVFSILLIIVYLKDKKNHQNKQKPSEVMKLYLCNLNIFFCSVVLLNNSIRLLPKSLTAHYYGDQEGVDEEDKKSNFLCKIQAFSVSLLDKLLLSLMTIYSVNHYLSVFHTEYYKNNMKKIYLLLTFIGIGISLILTIIFISDGISLKDVLCYIHTRRVIKKVTDNIYTTILFIVNLFCLTMLLHNLTNLKKKYIENGNQAMLKRSITFIKRFVFNLIINLCAFLYIFLLINKAFPKGNYKDLIYILICLLVELFFTFNEYLFKAFVRLITCNKFYRETESMLNEIEGNNTPEENTDDYNQDDF